MGRPLRRPPGDGRSTYHAERIDPDDGPLPGPANFFRGGPLETYDAEVRQAIRALGSTIDAASCFDIWNEALTARWSAPPVWVHGDFSAGNLLAKDQRRCAVLDFGQCCVGDPACDLAIAGTLFDPHARAVFRTQLRPDAGAWVRGRAWSLWKALIGAAELADTNAGEKARAWATLGRLRADRADA